MSIEIKLVGYTTREKEVLRYMMNQAKDFRINEKSKQHRSHSQYLRCMKSL